MITLSAGIAIGVLLSLVAVLAGKQFSGSINSTEKPYEATKMAQIIKNKDVIDEFLND